MCSATNTPSTSSAKNKDEDRIIVRHVPTLWPRAIANRSELSLNLDDARSGRLPALSE